MKFDINLNIFHPDVKRVAVFNGHVWNWQKRSLLFILGGEKLMESECFMVAQLSLENHSLFLI
jgi:hypothetical protein